MRTLINIFESTIGNGTGVSRPVSSTMFFTVMERQATSFSTSKTSSCFDLSFTAVLSASKVRGLGRVQTQSTIFLWAQVQGARTILRHGLPPEMHDYCPARVNG